MTYTYILIILLQTQTGLASLQTVDEFNYVSGGNLEKCEKFKVQAESALQSRKDIEIIYSDCIPRVGWELR